MYTCTVQKHSTANVHMYCTNTLHRLMYICTVQAHYTDSCTSVRVADKFTNISAVQALPTGWCTSVLYTVWANVHLYCTTQYTGSCTSVLYKHTTHANVRLYSTQLPQRLVYFCSCFRSVDNFALFNCFNELNPEKAKSRQISCGQT